MQPYQIHINKVYFQMLCLFVYVSNVRRMCIGSQDDAFDGDPEDPDYIEEPVEEFEGKSYRPLLDHVEPRFS